MPTPSASRFRRDPRWAALYSESIAPVWSRPFGALLTPRLESLQLPTKPTVLDVMCHAGDPGLQVLRRWPDARLIAIDPAAALIEQARLQAGRLVGRRVFFRTEAAEPNLPFDEAVYDLVLSNLGLHEAEQPRRLLREMVRVARPGAAVVATLPLRGSFGEFYALLGSLLKDQPRLAARLEVHLASWPDAAMVCDWAAEAGLVDLEIVTEPFSILVAGGTDLFFAPVIEYGPLSAWKAILGERGPAMQAIFSQLREAIDRDCAATAPFVLTIRAACLRGYKPRPPAPPTFEEDPANAPTNPGY
jgi:SAM-dependent methyltransferase